MRDTEWCEHATIFATACSQKIEIFIHKPYLNVNSRDGDQTQHITVGNATAVLHLSYHNRNHYNLLCPQDENDTNVLPFLFRNIFQNAREKTEIIILAPHDLTGKTLPEVFEQNATGQVYLVADYSQNLLQKILSDQDLPDTFRVFLTAKIPMQTKHFSRCRWLASLLVRL